MWPIISSNISIHIEDGSLGQTKFQYSRHEMSNMEHSTDTEIAFGEIRNIIIQKRET